MGDLNNSSIDLCKYQAITIRNQDHSNVLFSQLLKKLPLSSYHFLNSL